MAKAKTPRAKTPRAYTNKQMGDACEMLVAAEVTLAGVPALLMPANWPDYDIIAQPKVGVPQRIYARSRTFKRGGDTFVDFDSTAQFDWWAVVLLPGADQLGRRIFIIPKDVAEIRARRNNPATKWGHYRYVRQDKVAEIFPEYENNFRLSPTGVPVVPAKPPISALPSPTVLAGD
jgi:hypothetical protein